MNEPWRNTRQAAYDAMLLVKEARDIDDADYAMADAIHDALLVALRASGSQEDGA